MVNFGEVLASLPGYESLDLVAGPASDFRLNPLDGSVQVTPDADRPIYVEVGSSLLMITTTHEEMEKQFPASRLENLTTQAASIILGKPGGTVIGRSTTPELKLDVSASRQHVEIVQLASAMVIKDLGSTNGTSVHVFAPKIKRDYTRQLKLSAVPGLQAN